jgi:hypothetical protein
VNRIATPALVVRASILIVALAAGTAGAAPKNEPSITVHETRVVVTNVTPGASVALFGASMEVGDSIRLNRWQNAVVDTDKDGTVEWQIGVRMPWDTVWFAVDVDTGATAVGGPVESRFQRIDFPAPVLRRNGSNQIERFVTGRRMIDVLVVRPHVGAWVGYAADGHTTDGDGKADGRSTLVFASIRSLAGRVAAPKHLSARDVVIAVDLKRLQYYTTEVAQ